MRARGVSWCSASARSEAISSAAEARDGSGREWRLTAAVHNLTNRKYWRWSDVQGLAANLPTIDAWSQPGRSVSVSLVGRF